MSAASYKGKVFNDHIHGHIELSPLAVRIIDTSQFQRLRDISQLGGSSYVFAGATNKRFDHSIGVAHLAKKFVTLLRDNQPELNISDQDVLCVEIAGLIHDLGHGIFSHTFESLFLGRYPAAEAFRHEHASIGIFDVLIEDNALLPAFGLCGLCDADIHFIKELVLGDIREAPAGFTWRGRGDKTFLYDIVANKRNGIDVDKFDYIKRDCNLLGIGYSFDSGRLMNYARVHLVPRLKPTGDNLSAEFASEEGGSAEAAVAAEEESLHICFDNKEAWGLQNLFHTRYDLHKRAYQHKTVGAVELMLVDALSLADPYKFVEGTAGARLRMSECFTDMRAYWRLQEYIIKILRCPQMREIIERIRRRDLYSFVEERLLSREDQSKVKGVHSFVLEALRSRAMDEVVSDDDVIVRVVSIGYGGRGGVNPAETADLYISKCVSEDGFKRVTEYEVGTKNSAAVSRLIPKECDEKYVRLYCRIKSIKAFAAEAFKQWCESAGQTDNVQFTPHRSAVKRKRDDEM